MKRKRWTIGKLAGLLWTCAAAGAVGPAGCKQQLFLEPADHRTTLDRGLMAKLETSPHEAVVPVITPLTQPPATVEDMDRPVRNMSLKEAIAIGMEQGNVGGQSTNPGFLQDILPQFTGRTTSGTDTIRAFAIQPAIAAAEIERSLSKFDARFISSMTWNQTDNPTLTLQQSFSNGDSATLSSTLAKPLPTGGVAGITFSTQYLKLAQPPTNPQFVALASSYTPRLQFVFEQPLLQNFGVEVNQLNPNHPGSLLIPGFRTTGAGTEGILLTRVRLDQQRADFDRQVNLHLLNIEAAYWNLYSAYYNLAAREEGAKQALGNYLYFANRQRVGIVRDSVLYQNLAQYRGFRTQITQARTQVLESERNFRGVLGMRSDDGTRIVPTDEPNIVEFKPDWVNSFQEMVAYRPELMIIRQEVKARQLDLLNQKNLRRPDLRLLTSYDIAGLGPRLDGGGDRTNAFRSLAANNFNTWQVGLRLDMPIGFRDANGLVRQADLNLKSTFFQMLDAERKANEVLARTFRDVTSTHKLIVDNREQRIALQKQLEQEVTRKIVGSYEPNDVTTLLQAQQNLALVIAQEYAAIANYNTALASLEYAKGTIQRYNNVTVGEGPLPDYVNKKAADHFAAREHAIKLREHPASEQPLPPLGARPEASGQPGGTPNVVSPTVLDGPLFGVPPAAPSDMVPVAPATQEVPPAPAPAQPKPMSLGTGAVPTPVRRQLVPSDAAATPTGTFQPTGTVVLPTRSRPISTEAPGQ
jgi:outer membrane protein TolC